MRGLTAEQETETQRESFSEKSKRLHLNPRDNPCSPVGVSPEHVRPFGGRPEAELHQAVPLLRPLPGEPGRLAAPLSHHGGCQGCLSAPAGGRVMFPKVRRHQAGHWVRDDTPGGVKARLQAQRFRSWEACWVLGILGFIWKKQQGGKHNQCCWKIASSFFFLMHPALHGLIQSDFIF